MGMLNKFSREEIIQALQSKGGNSEVALDYLLSKR